MNLKGATTTRIAVLAALAIYVLPGLALADEMVLCVAGDGRMSLEAARDGRCVNSHDEPCREPSGGEEGTCPSRPAGCCGPCLDVPISLTIQHEHHVSAPGGLAHEETPPAGPCDDIQTLTQHLPALSAGSPGISPVARSALDLLRTTVIVI